MRILILGAGSFAGQALFSQYLKRNWNVVGINRSSPKDKYHWQWINNIETELKWHCLNINDNSDQIIHLATNFQPEIIIDLMGQGMVAPSWDDPSLWYQVNITLKAKLLQSFLKIKSLKKYIRASTPEVYGSSEAFLKEDSNFNPSTPYAVSHCAIDSHIRCLGRQNNFPYIIGRFSNFYGSGQQLYRVIPRLFLSCITRKKFILDGQGTSTRFFINSEDIISAFDCMIESEEICNEYNFSGEDEVSISQLVDQICNLTKTSRSIIVKNGPERAGKDAHYRLDCSKAHNKLNWKPKVSLKSGLTEVYEWISSNIEVLSKRSWDYKHLR